MTTELNRQRLDAALHVCTDNERQVLALIAAGYSRRRGAAKLGISESSFRDRQRNALRKIQRHLDAQEAS